MACPHKCDTHGGIEHSHAPYLDEQTPCKGFCASEVEFGLRVREMPHWHRPPDYTPSAATDRTPDDLLAALLADQVTTVKIETWGGPGREQRVFVTVVRGSFKKAEQMAPTIHAALAAAVEEAANA